ncbi:putative sulfate exporter family transporter [Staphylococcus massiliensis CCUG 55927]|uniref:YeiH family protein n=1 Tax=Staphylococcus massiliensis TaxID=555791 RepID=UPI0003014D0A|nr:YeiH family protein [Staphylococcus massiliensis]PNZ97617.1 putative sulfate exporter family transporter [Staphylococcus massiliensis CCUG 55927]
MNKLRGILLTLSIAILATILGHFLPLVGSAIFAIIIGIIINNTMRIPKSFEKGIKFSSKKILHYSIICLGFTLIFNQIGQTGLKSLPIILITLISAFLAVYILMKVFHIDKHLSILVGVGTAICGGSAIAATSPVIKAKEQEIAYAISTVFLFNLLAVIIFPPLGHLLHMSQETFGYFSGTAINDTSSVVAAAANYGDEALTYGTVVKLTRTLMIIPVVLFFTYRMYQREKAQASNVSIKKIFPWFILYFLFASLISTLFGFSEEWINVFKTIATFLISMALAGIGLSVNFKQLKASGMKPIMLGLVTWLVVILTSFLSLFLMGMI